MSDEEKIDDAIQKAADQYQPPYNDTAWNAMEQLLEEHIPQNKDRRRIIYFSLVLLLGAGILYIMLPLNKKVSSLKSVEKIALKNKSQPAPTPLSHQQSSPVLKDVADNLRTNRSADLPRNDSHQASLHSPMKKPYHFSFNNKAKEEMQPASENVVSDIENRQGKPHHPSINKKAQSHLNSQITISETTEIDNSSKSDAVADVVHDSNSAKKDTIVSTKNEQPTAKNANVDTGKNTSHKQNRASKSFKRSFSIGVGAGPDVSGVNLDNTGKVTFAYGAQLGYTLSKNFTIRTGFYVARKIYSADAADYHQQGGGNYNYLSSVNANCKVYEIPLTVSYNFGDVKKHAWFVSTGLSSYFMKKESYEYFYKDPSGVTYNTSWSVSNKNQHYLSVLDICGGYMYFVNKQFSLIAEPSLKLPLAGIGVGKIKLNSAGILFTVAIKPFN